MSHHPTRYMVLHQSIPILGLKLHRGDAYLAGPPPQRLQAVPIGQARVPTGPRAEGAVLCCKARGGRSDQRQHERPPVRRPVGGTRPASAAATSAWRSYQPLSHPHSRCKQGHAPTEHLANAPVRRRKRGKGEKGNRSSTATQHFKRKGCDHKCNRSMSQLERKAKFSCTTCLTVTDRLVVHFFIRDMNFNRNAYQPRLASGLTRLFSNTSRKGRSAFKEGATNAQRKKEQRGR